MRTHSIKADNYESDGSTDSNNSSNSKSVEFNNNKILIKPENYKKRKFGLLDETSRIIDASPKRIKEDEEFDSYIRCPVCDRDDFSSPSVLQMHLEDNHPDYPAKCKDCGQIFKNTRALIIHKHTFHSDENGKKNYIMGFKDLTYMDFSSEKFPQIARVECEKNFHKTTGNLKFICQKCTRAFPCANSLDIHKKDCGAALNLNENSFDLSKNGKLCDEVRRNDFFARLDLQNTSPDKNQVVPQETTPPIPNKLQQRLLDTMKTIDSSKDLADIQSIISMTTNGSILHQLQAKSESQNHFPQENSKEEEETQDAFTAEFRKMKLRGEFPCRLCTAVFPNLRALKGHNRAHLNGNNNGTYRCNMCPHSSIDKAALIRHMRTHNGDRPYECSLCNYAFTTKANCERHLRNRHAKTIREDIKKAIIYHPSEDPTNDEINKLAKEDSYKKFNCSTDSDILAEKMSTPKNDILPKLPDDHHPDFNSLLPISKLHALKELPAFPNNIISPELKDRPQLSPYPPPFAPNFTNTSTPHSKIQVKSLELLKQPPTPEYNQNQSDDEDYDKKYIDEDPQDMVLDLSKKKTIDEDKYQPQDLSKKTETPSPNINELLQQQLLNAPKLDALYAAQLAMYRNSFQNLSPMPSWPGFINPLLFQTMQNPLLQQDPQQIKDRLQRFCGGGMMVDNFAEHLKNLQSLNNSNIPAYPMKLNLNNEVKLDIKYPEKINDIKPLSLNIDNSYSETLNKMQSPISQPKSDLLQSPNSVKMVIKNGVLMPKQKQRRYRTERPFSCEHCSARFTLRSNMERHIKQQHPQYWSQRQRSNVGTPGRKPHSLQPKGLCELTIPNYDIPKIESDEFTKDHITDKLKYAILAQHLRASQMSQETKKEEDDDCALVIDENDERNERSESFANDSYDKIDGRNESDCEGNDDIKIDPERMYEKKTEQNGMETPKIDHNVSNNFRQNNSSRFSAKDTEEFKSEVAFPGQMKDNFEKTRILEEKLKQLREKHVDFSKPQPKQEESGQDLVPVSRLLDNASQQPFKDYFCADKEYQEVGGSEEDEEGLVASSTSEGNNSGTDENR